MNKINICNLKDFLTRKNESLGQAQKRTLPHLEVGGKKPGRTI